MKKYIIPILFILLVLTPVSHAYTVGTPSAKLPPAFSSYAPDAGAADQGVTDTGVVTLKNLVDEIGTSKKATIIFSHTGAGNTTTYTLTTSENIPFNISLEIENGAIIDGAGTLTIFGEFSPGPRQLFGSSITVEFGDDAHLSPIQYVYPQWWGARGDNSHDDTFGLQSAFSCEWHGKNIVIGESTLTVKIPPGGYRFTSDLILTQENMVVQGTNTYNTVLFWYGEGDPAVAGMYNDLDYFQKGSRLEDFTIHMRGASNACKISGWNEFCGLERMVFRGHTGVGLEIGDTASGYESQDFAIHNIHILADSSGADKGLYLNNARRLSIDSLTTAVGSTYPGHDIGIDVDGFQNVFTNIHLESCGMPLNLGPKAQGTVFIGLHSSNSNRAKVARTFDGINATWFANIDALVRNYTFISVFDNQAPGDYFLRDARRHITIPTHPDNEAYQQIIATRDDYLVVDSARIGGIIALDLVEITTSTDDLDVSSVNSVHCDSTGGNIVLGGLQGGVNGQMLFITKKVFANDVIIEHSEGVGTQDIITADGNDITLSAYGGVLLRFVGSGWYEVSH